MFPAKTACGVGTGGHLKQQQCHSTCDRLHVSQMFAHWKYKKVKIPNRGPFDTFWFAAVSKYFCKFQDHRQLPPLCSSFFFGLNHIYVKLLRPSTHWLGAATIQQFGVRLFPSVT